MLLSTFGKNSCYVTGLSSIGFGRQVYETKLFCNTPIQGLLMAYPKGGYESFHHTSSPLHPPAHMSNDHQPAEHHVTHGFEYAPSSLVKFVTFQSYGKSSLHTCFTRRNYSTVTPTPTQTNISLMRGSYIVKNYSSVRTNIHKQNDVDTFEPDFGYVKRPNAQTSDPRLFTYFMVGTAGVFAAMAAKSAVVDFVSSLSAAGDQLAMAQTEVDLSNIPIGKNVIIKWRGKPIFIRHRSDQEIEDMNNVPLEELRDPQLDSERVQKPEWLVMLGICTHLGCVPLGDTGDFQGGWYCPCHGSHYDVSGRIRKGPAPLNLEIPKYKFTDENVIVIG